MKDIVNNFNFGYDFPQKFYILDRQAELEIHLPPGFAGALCLMGQWSLVIGY